MQITRDNYSQYAQMVQQMFGKKASSNDPLAQCDYGNFSLRFKPVDINFTKPKGMLCYLQVFFPYRL